MRFILVASATIDGCAGVSWPLYSNRTNSTDRSCSRVHSCCANKDLYNDTASAELTVLIAFGLKPVLRSEKSSGPTLSLIVEEPVTDSEGTVHGVAIVQL